MGLFDREDRGQRFDIDGDSAARFFQEIAIGVRQQQDRLFGVLEKLLDQVGLIIDNQSDDVLAGDVLRGDDGELVPRDFRREGDVADAAARAGSANGRSVEHAGQDSVVDVDRFPGDFVPALFARDGGADGVLSHVLVYRVGGAIAFLDKRLLWVEREGS